jgi:RNA polymerase sigma factor (sigma-70 family)
METSAASDSELLTAWVTHRREPAFHALVARYATLVHMAAKRTCGDDALAADASQLVFIILAQKAKSLTTHPTLAGWLHVTAVMKTRDLIDKARRESRKRQHFSAEMETRNPSHSIDAWQEMQPVLDDALAALSANDREAILLRFYRSLTIREIGETLGIATDAAQKRIARATERLRGKLAKRGCQAGGTLAATMLAGFAADASAATPAVTLLVSKALASGAVSNGILTLLTMKSTSVILPVIALALTGFWIGTQRQTISTMKKETILLKKQIASADALAQPVDSSIVKTKPPLKSETGNEPINWKEFVAQIPQMRQFGDTGQQARLKQRLQSMSTDELIAEQDAIAALDIPSLYKNMLQEIVMEPFFQKAPELALSRFIEHPTDDTDTWHYPNEALKKWAMDAPDKATAWFDAQVAAGEFDSKSLDGKNPLRIRFENTLISALLASDPSTAGQHLETIPADQRADVLNGLSVDTKNQAAFAKLVRAYVPELDQTKTLAQQASRNPTGGSYVKATEFMDQIEATPRERTACVEQVAVSEFQQIPRNSRKVTRKDLDALREWAGTMGYASPDTLTGKALGSVLAGGRSHTSYDELGELAVKYSRDRGNDDLLVAFLKEPGGYIRNQTSARALVEKVSDEIRREEILKWFSLISPNP